MLKRFEVENFKGFKDRLVFDLTAENYDFNSGIVKNGIVNKAIVYGKNGVGKSSLGIAISDIISHLTDKEKIPRMYVTNYRNLYNPESAVKFKYFFQFGKDEVVYEYMKIDQENLVEETFTVNEEKLLEYNYLSAEKRYISKKLQGNLNIELLDNKLSVLKYIYRNTPTNNCFPVLTEFIQFCENILWYRSLSEGNSYTGFMNGGSLLPEHLYESGRIHEFETFLRDNGLDYTLKFISINGRHELVATYGSDTNSAPFISLASTGTMALFLYYIWSITAFNKISLLLIDEFDAFLHYESAANIVKSLNNRKDFQTILTTHNTNLMQNSLTRPDCCFIMTNNKISSLCNATDRELKEAHNLEKMYVNGAFL